MEVNLPLVPYAEVSDLIHHYGSIIARRRRTGGTIHGFVSLKSGWETMRFNSFGL
jgi:hypothetical protein